ncbi:MAG: hypothetical protein Greene041679_511, partial [Parcubacteria group bacterium Greene0416_79]
SPFPLDVFAPTSRSMGSGSLLYERVFYDTFAVMSTVTITIPRSVARSRNLELVAIPRADLEALIERASDEVSEKDVLRWSGEARALKRTGKLPVLRSLGRL